jgi:penicillin-binding protein 2
MHSTLKKIQKKTSFKRGYRSPLIEPDEIFLDSQNLPDFDTQQFEGQLDKPISRRSLFALGIVFCLIVALFGGRLWTLQIAHSQQYQNLSEKNSLAREPIFSSRGNIYDRNGVPLAWNETKTEAAPWGLRSYIGAPGFSHLLGYVGYPAKDKSGYYWKTEISGKDGVEKAYNDALNGTNGSTIVERDIAGEVQSGAIVNAPVAGQNLTLTVDSRLQAKMQEVLATYVRQAGFRSASAVMMNVKNGDVVVMTSVPEYDPNVMAHGKNTAKIREYLTDPNTPLLNRAISGLFTPGSIVKPYVALEALRQKVVTPNTQICSCGSITVPNPYDPEHPGIFRDYNPNNGWVDIRHAIAVSSNIFFMEVAGGYHEQKGIGVESLGTSLKRFGLTEKTGVDLGGERSGIVPSPAWKAERFRGEGWRIGDTYNTAIGQYGVQVTPIEMVRAVAAIARGGVLVTPHVLKNDESYPERKITEVSDSDYVVVREGMRLGAEIGTGKILSTLPFTSGSKTGTAQVGANAQYVNAWMNMFFPYEDPEYALVIVMERGPQVGLGASQRAAKDFLDWVVLNAPEYTK